MAGASESSSGPLHTPQPAPLPGPTDRVVYAIGDIHGRADLLARLHGMILSDAARRGRRAAVAVHLGDYVDRGRESRAVLDRLTDDPLPGLQTAFLCGNHDAWMRAFLDDPEAGRGWLVNGGRETLASYGIPSVSTDPSLRELRRLRADLGAAMPAAHRDFLDGLQLTWREGDYLFVHAGVRPGVPLARQDPDDLINIRQPFLASQSRFDGALVVHGHTIVNTPQVHDNRIALDTGAYATGRLTALVIDGAEISILQT
ncbi:metallophosphoesterase [Rhodovibrio salinarum]|uniref:metallophosphoesterase n=1 Tax=Rhodovibrio salinarum TaxID=1087 RepID=UPI001470E6BF|nr:metallophosphoesterase [Rhodovibrio salinarum]